MQLCHCNLSPQGDGNLMSSPPMTKSVRLQFIPARGRKLFAGLLGVCSQRNCNLSPQGDGNLLLSITFAPLSLQFIPARGRKLCAFCVISGNQNCNLSPQGDGNITGKSPSIVRNIAIYPRKGTETYGTNLVEHVVHHCNLSPQGDGNHILASIAFSR